MPAFLLVEFLLIAVLYRCCSAKYYGEGAAVGMLAAYTLHISIVIGLGLLLGNLGLLTPGLYISAVCAAAIVVTMVLICRSERAGEQRSFLRVDISPWAAALLAMLLLLVVMVVIRAALYEPYTTDALWYHLPMVLLMDQEGGFAASRIPLFDGYPRNIELWQFWIFSFKGDVSWLDAAQVGFLPLWLLGVYVIARHINATRRSALFGAVASLFAPVVLSQLCTALIDVAVGSLLLASVALGLQALKKEGVFRAATFGAALGVLLGAKFTGIPFAVITGLWFLLSKGFLSGRKNGSRFFLVVVTAATLLGSPFYISNLVRHGNPVYPYRVELGGVVLDGPYQRSEMWEERMWDAHPEAPVSNFVRVLRSWTAFGQTGYGWYEGGFGLIWFLMAAAMLVYFARSLRPLNRDKLFLGSLFVVLFLATPLHYSVRFVIFLLGFGGVALADWVSSLRRVYLNLLICILVFLAALGTTFQMFRTWRIQTHSWHLNRLELCRYSSFPVEYRGAFSWLQENELNHQRITAVVGEEWEISLLCLWGPGEFRRVDLLYDPPSKEPKKGELLFLPLRGASGEFYRAQAEKMEPLYADSAVVVAAWHGGG